MIALDTGFLIYGTQQERRRALSDVESARVPLAIDRIDEIQSSGQPIMVPAPAAWEYVLDFPVSEQKAVWRAMNGFVIAPFDPCAARIAAEISRRHSDRITRTKPSRLPAVGSRQQVKVDIQILAIAIAQRANAIYTLEVERFSEWANGLIQVSGLFKTMSA